MKWIVDIEANGYYNEATAVHCVVCRDAENPGNVKVFSARTLENAQRNGSIMDGVRFLDGEEWIGQNLVGYDIPLLTKLGFKPNPGEVFDTLSTARLFWTEIRLHDDIMRRRNPDYIPAKLRGYHSLEAWGHRLGCLKGAYGKTESFETYTHSMLEYCIQDTLVTHRLWAKQQTVQWPKGSIDLERDFAKNIAGIMNRGFPFDVKKAEALACHLQETRAILMEKIAAHPTFTPLVKRWVTPAKKLQREKVTPFNPNSDRHVIRVLLEQGWKPLKFTPGGLPQVDAKALKPLKFPGVDILRDYIETTTTLTALAEGKGAWLKLVKPDGRIYQFINHNGAVTGRCTHSSPAANAPKVRLKKVALKDGTFRDERVLGLAGKFGVEFRGCVAPTQKSGLVLVGADASSGEARELAHYMAKFDGGAYAETVVNGDIHEFNRVAAGLATRDQAKTFFYALLYGAGDAKIGSIIGGSAEDGRKLKERYFANLPALSSVIASMHSALVKRGQAERYFWKGKNRIKILPGAYLIGLDGRRLYIRSEHSMLNTLLQGALALCMKKATNLVHERVPDVRMVLHMHDEFQSECEPEFAHELGRIKVQAIRDAGTFFNLRCPLDGEYKIGPNWAETH